MMNEIAGKAASCLAITEKRQAPTRPGGCVGIFFQLVHWHRRFAKKKLLSRKLLPPARVKQVSRNFHREEKMPVAKLHLIADENKWGFPNSRRNGNKNLDPEQRQKYETQAPGLVARLMGLESMPAAQKKVTRPLSCDTRHGKVEKFLLGSKGSAKEDVLDIEKGQLKHELRPQKLQKTGPLERRAATRFGAEALQIKGVLTKSRKQHQPKLLSPVESPRISSIRNASRTSRLIDAAARILEPGLQAGSRVKCALPYSTSAYPSSELGIAERSPSQSQNAFTRAICSIAEAGPAGGCRRINAESNHDLKMLLDACQDLTNNTVETSCYISVPTSGDRSIHHHTILSLSNRVIATGSHGTTVFHGTYCGRSVAVKRLVRGHCEIAKGILTALLDCRHPNVVLCEPFIESKDFTFICQDLCNGNLTDLVSANANISKLWTAPGHPSSLLLKLMRDMTLAVAHLHESNIVHGAIRPNNVLISGSNTLSVKLTDVGIVKCLEGNSIWENHDCGWQGPEMFCPGAHPTRKGDMFSLGCVFYFCVTLGNHVFGEPLLRQFRIQNHLHFLNSMVIKYEIRDLIRSLLRSASERRPKAWEVLKHPAFWNAEMRLQFLHDVSDRLQLEPISSDLSKQFQGPYKGIFGGLKWRPRLHPDIIKHLDLHKVYDAHSVKALLQVICNSYSHQLEAPPHIRAIEGSVPEGLDSYYSKRFPELLMHSYRLIYSHCRSEDMFRKYFSK